MTIPPASSRHRVLVVDDNPDMLEILRMLLGNEGFEVSTAPDPVSALAALEESVPDVLVLDIMMPVRSGIDVLEAIRWNRRYAAMPVVIFTAVSLPEADHRFVNEFARACLDKTDISRLVPTLREIVGESG